MPATFTLKGIPDEVYRRLKEKAKMNHRSINKELLHRLERDFMLDQEPTGIASNADGFLKSFGGAKFDAREVVELIREDRDGSR